MTDTTAQNRPTGPLAYAQKIIAHAQRTKHVSVFPGQNYRGLADFLTRPYGPLARPRLRSKCHHDPALVTLYEHDREGRVAVQRLGPDPSDLAKVAAYADGSGISARFLFIRGLPNPDWLNHIGSPFRVDPEFFRRHLGFLEPQEHFDLPCVPSASSHIFKLPIITIGMKMGHNISSAKSFTLKREEVCRNVEAYLRNIAHEPIAGQSIVRRVSVHDERYITLEQEVSGCIQRSADGCNVIIWSDCGQQISQDTLSAWVGTTDPVSLLPTYQYGYKMALRSVEVPSDVLSDSNSPTCESPYPSTPLMTSDTFQSASLLHLSHGNNLDPKTMACDAFYALSSLCSFVASSSSQYLNFLSELLAQDQSTSSLYEPWLEKSDALLERLKHIEACLLCHSAKLSSIILWVRTRGGSHCNHALTSTNSNSTHPQTREASIAEAAAQSLLADFEYLAARAEQLLKQCADQTGLLMNRAALGTARQGIEQGEAIRRLTLLAFHFLPLGITTSFFGMNFRELTGSGGSGSGCGKEDGVDEVLGIWIWFAISVPIFGASVLYCFWATVKKWVVSRMYRCYIL